MQAILIADYSFTPTEYWRNVSLTARDFIKKCLTIDPHQRMTSHQALQHTWMKSTDPTSPEVTEGGGEDLLPTVKKNFNARRTLHKAIDTVRAINKLREGGGLMHGGNAMDGGLSHDPRPKGEQVNGSKVMNDQGESMEGIAHGGSGALEEKTNEPPEKTTAQGGDAMEIDSRGNARGQTHEQILRQEQKIKDTMSGMWKDHMHKSTR
jgi:calcium/calmodulin-dependent protein kinase I